MAQILVSGSIAYDRIMNFDGLFKDYFLPDKLHNINLSFQILTLVQHFGGTAGNIAYNLALLNEQPTILANIGSDAEQYLEYLKKNNINTDSLASMSDVFTSTAHIVTDKGDNQITAFYMGSGARSYGKETNIGSDDIVIVGAGNIHDMENFPIRAKKAGAKFLFDPGQAIPALAPSVIGEGLQGADVLFVNDYELSMISNQTGLSESDIAERVSTLIITLGKDGSRVISEGSEQRVSAVAANEIKDPTGAGDAYRAGYIKGMRLGKSPADCAKLGSAVAVYAVESVGTQEHRFTIDALKKRYSDAYGESLEI